MPYCPADKVRTCVVSFDESTNTQLVRIAADSTAPTQPDRVALYKSGGSLINRFRVAVMAGERPGWRPSRAGCFRSPLVPLCVPPLKPALRTECSSTMRGLLRMPSTQCSSCTPLVLRHRPAPSPSAPPLCSAGWVCQPAAAHATLAALSPGGPAGPAAVWGGRDGLSQLPIRWHDHHSHRQ